MHVHKTFSKIFEAERDDSMLYDNQIETPKNIVYARLI